MREAPERLTVAEVALLIVMLTLALATVAAVATYGTGIS